jgi:hypothetical protein
MPARSIVSNRNQMRQAREVLKALPPKQREELRYQGIGPGDSYIGMWRMVNAYRFELNALCKAQARDNVTPIEERQLERDIRYYSEQITFLYAKLLVHEKPKLASVEFKGDQQRPIYQEVDLKIPMVSKFSCSTRPAAMARVRGATCCRQSPQRLRNPRSS